MHAARDNPWPRLLWLFPLSLVVSALSLEAFFVLLAGGRYAPQVPKAIDVEVVKLPPAPPPRAPAVEPAPQATVDETPPPAAAAEAALPEPVPTVETPPAAPAPPALAPVSHAEPPAAPAPPEARVPAAPASTMTSPPAPRRAQIATAPPVEVTRGGFAGMQTEPLAPAPPLSKEEWEKGAALYDTGNDQQGQVEGMRGPNRAARSERVAPLTKEEYERLAKIHHTGDDQQGQVEAMRGPIRAARSARSRPLTKEEYAAQTKIYWTGMSHDGETTPAITEAGRRGALSFEASLVAPAASIDYSARFGASNHDRTAIATAQPPPELPADLPLTKAVVVVARFHVLADGSFEVTLVTPTPEPRLDDALMAAFKTWRFEPASRAGRAVDSTIDYRLTVAPALGVKVASMVKLLDAENPAEVARRGTPASPIEAPPPELPAALMKPGAQWNAVARVHVARDGTAEVTITEPTADSAVTRALEEALRRWRFRPTSIQGRQPQDSTIELSVALSVS